MVVDLRTVENLGRIDCTNAEVAAVLNVSPSLVTKRRDIQEALAKGREEGRASIRRAQYQKALGQSEIIEIQPDGTRRTTQGRVEPNVAMLIWLGKQRLGQKEQAVVSQADLPEIRIVDMTAPYPPLKLEKGAEG